MSFPEMKMDVLEIIRYYEYPGEQYDVTTEDGYILTIQRIPYGKSGPGDKPRQPVIVHHGFLCSSAVWVLNTPADSLGFILADAGYDVWLSNSRGNTYGRKHVRLNPEKKEFWEFSFDEMGRYDLPATIDFVLSKTGLSQTHYIGHSMATTMMFVTLSSKPEYNDKVRSFIALGPAISMQYVTSPLNILQYVKKNIQFLCDFLENYEVLPNSRVNNFFASLICKYMPLNQLCSTLITTISGSGPSQLNLKRLPVYLIHLPAGASLQTLLHYIQLTKPGFRRFDYGPSINMIKYEQPTPPLYDMSKVTVPVAVFWSENDTLADPTDVDILMCQVPNLVFKLKVPSTAFIHLDFFWGIDVKALVYDKVLKVMRELWTFERL